MTIVVTFITARRRIPVNEPVCISGQEQLADGYRKWNRYVSLHQNFGYLTNLPIRTDYFHTPESWIDSPHIWDSPANVNLHLPLVPNWILYSSFLEIPRAFSTQFHDSFRQNFNLLLDHFYKKYFNQTRINLNLNISYFKGSEDAEEFSEK